MREIAGIIAGALSDNFEAEHKALLERSRALMQKYPLYPDSQRPTPADGEGKEAPAPPPPTRPSWL